MMMHRMTRRAAAPLALLLVAATPLAAQEDEAVTADSAAIAAAEEAASPWLDLVDEGDYEASWEQAAPMFQEAVPTSTWMTNVEQARGAFEPFGERTRIGAQHLVDPPNAPAGEYVLLQYRTQVSGDRTVVETVVPMKTDDGWKVSGYFVNPE